MNTHINRRKPVKERANYGSVPVIVCSASTPKVELRLALKNSNSGQKLVTLTGHTPERKPSIREAILSSSSMQIAIDFHSLGKSFKLAAPKTRRCWDDALELRHAQLLREHMVEKNKLLGVHYGEKASSITQSQTT